MSDQARHKGHMRPLPAFLLAPLSAFLVMPLIGFRMEGDPSEGNLIVTGIFFYILFLFMQLVIAAPLRWFQAKMGWQSVWIDGGLGAVALVMPTIALMPFPLEAEGISVHLRPGMILVMAVLGAAIGLAYGLLRLRDRRASLVPTPADLAARFD